MSELQGTHAMKDVLAAWKLHHLTSFAAKIFCTATGRCAVSAKLLRHSMHSSWSRTVAGGCSFGARWEQKRIR